MITDQQMEKLKQALKLMAIAEGSVKQAAVILGKTFGTNVPNLSAKGLEVYCDTINGIDKYLQHLKSFARVSVLQQLATPKEDSS